MNHYFIAIYDGVFPTEKLHTILQSNPTFTDLNIRPLKISSPRPFTLLVGEEHDADILTIDVLLSSPLLDPNTSEKNTEEYSYLQQLAESISRSELCTSIKASSLI